MKNEHPQPESERAVIYARYSSYAQTEQSIEGQLRDGYAWAEQQGVTVISEYIDRALSGKSDSRPEFQRMIDDAAKKQFSLVIVWKLDRFARNRYDSAIYKARLKKFGVRVVSVKEAITDSPEGIILEGLLESMAEYYSANLAQNVRRGLRESIAKGWYCGGPIPYGYKVQDHHLVADEKTAPVIRYVFAQYAKGVSKTEIFEELSRRGVRGMRGKPLTKNSFQHNLTNTAYVGRYVYAGEVIPGLAEPLIDEDTFAKVQEKLKVTRRAPAAKKAKVDYLLQGKVFCGHCGSPMIGESGYSHTGAVYHYYACATRKKTHACGKKNERKDVIEKYVVEQTMRYVLASSRTSRVARAVVAEYNKEFSDSRVTEMEKAVATFDRELEKLVDALIDSPKSAHPRIYARMESIEAQKAEMETDLARLRITQSIRLTESDVLSWLRQFCSGDPDDESFRRRIIDTFINSIYLYDDRILIFYNIHNSAPVPYTAILESSDLTANGVLKASKSEPHYIFVNGVFGCLIQRDAG